MTILITDQNITGPNYPAEKLLVDFACFLYDQRRVSIGKASKLAKLNRLEFQKALADRGLYMNYDEEELEVDLKNLGLL